MFNLRNYVKVFFLQQKTCVCFLPTSSFIFPFCRTKIRSSERERQTFVWANRREKHCRVRVSKLLSLSSDVMRPEEAQITWQTSEPWLCWAVPPLHASSPSAGLSRGPDQVACPGAEHSLAQGLPLTLSCAPFSITFLTRGCFSFLCS